MNLVMMQRDIEYIKRAIERIETEIARLKGNLPVQEAVKQADTLNASLLKRPVLSRKK